MVTILTPPNKPIQRSVSKRETGPTLGEENTLADLSGSKRNPNLFANFIETNSPLSRSMEWRCLRKFSTDALSSLRLNQVAMKTAERTASNHRGQSKPPSTGKLMSGRRRKRGWREQRKYRPERVAFFVALAAAILVVVTTMLVARMERARGAAALPAPAISSQSDSTGDAP